MVPSRCLTLRGKFPGGIDGLVIIHEELDGDEIFWYSHESGIGHELKEGAVHMTCGRRTKATNGQ